ncbi:sensor domain-containing diguanylate cyclase [Rugamonas sp. DEMB1]|uniref:sensor domain-containing diguanylate cyclase n=1 Tax=Rugamonas sp. DEMB1 TaxID=3039386 RepID=UPI00244CF60F|nr:sensor domain-containing diguanylate cyclase [Rugamonas sp. DEMB1]WGG52337.1 sensor domain-containing diguanylate cyclase [Rugamonas sp. DEMB1]
MLLACSFIVLVCLSLVAVQVWQTMHSRSVQLQQAERASANLANAVAQHAYDTLKEADTVLVGLVDRMEHGGAGDVEMAHLRDFLLLRTGELPQLQDIFIFDAAGRWRLNLQPTPLANQDISEREYFTYHRDHADRGAHIGPPIRSKASGKWVVTVSRRLNRADGGFAGVVLAAIDMQYFLQFYQRFDIGRAGAIFVASDSGIMLMRRPFEEKSLGRDISKLPLFSNYLPKAASGTTVFTSGQDGVTRINSYRRMQQYPLVVSAALAQDEVLAEWRADAYLSGAVVGVLLLGLGWLGGRLLKQIRRRIEAEAELLLARHALEKLNHTLEEMAMQDGLTGLANRRRFDAALSEEFSRASREASALALVMIDVDHFKLYNDNYGHAAGDECLRAIGRAVGKGPRRPGDVVARYGGEEMVLLLPGTDMQGALLVAEKVRAAVEGLRLTHAGNAGGVVTVSAGVEAFDPVTRDRCPLELIEAADRAMYRAKEEGRNRVCACGGAVARTG